jgi:predicted dehydrogenase
LCDVYEPNLDLARKDSPAGVRTYVDYREMLAQPGLDLVVIATPDHQHMPNLLASLAAGKDVYLEKPFSHTLDQNRTMIDAARKSGRIVQVGMQRRSMEYILRARRIVEQGTIGPISHIQASWNMVFNAPLRNDPLEGKLDWERFLGPAPKRPLDPKRFRWWRAFWDYSGGNLTDQGAHLMDVVQWVGGLERPVSAVCHGIVKNATAGEVPDVFNAAIEYPGVLVSYSLNYCTNFDFDWRVRFLSAEGGMVMDRSGVKVYRGADMRKAVAQGTEAGPVLHEKGSFETAPHIQNFLECVRTRQRPNCPPEIAAAAIAGPHLANAALRRGTRARLDPVRDIVS